MIKKMVSTDEMNMFWGLTLEGGKRYEQTAERGFHISMACLEPLSTQNDEIITVSLEQSKKKFILCCLQPHGILQQPLDLNFAEGENIAFFINGKGKVHLTGYSHIDNEDMGQSLDEFMSSDEDLSNTEFNLQKKKRKIHNEKDSKIKKRKISNSDKSTSLIDDEAEEASHEITNDDDEDEDEDEVDNDDEDDDNEEDEIDEYDSEEDNDKDDVDDTKDYSSSFDSKNSLYKINKQKKALNSNHNSSNQKLKTPEIDTSNNENSRKKKKNRNKFETATDSTDSNLNNSIYNKSKEVKNRRKSLEGGIVIEDIKSGSGNEAKPGKHISVFYTGRLQNGKIFDQKIAGNPFKFKLGKKEVVAGWDIGLKGMKIGGKRKLIIPPKYGYGDKSAGTVPPNSTLIFDVELKAVH